MATLSRVFNLMCNSKCSPTTPVQHATPVWALPRSLATTWGIICYFLFLRVLRCFSSPGWLSFEWYVFNVSGCPIRKSSDITLVCSSPKLIAAYHVLHRLLSPRHPPYALNCFKYFSINIKVYNVNLYFKLYYLRRFVTAIDRKNHIAVIFIFSDNYDGTINHTNITKSFWFSQYVKELVVRIKIQVSRCKTALLFDLHRYATIVMIMDLNHSCAFNASSNLSILKNLFRYAY